MIDFRELTNYETFEDLCENLLRRKGLEVRRLGRGPAQLGKDIVAREPITGIISGGRPKTWLVECKYTSNDRLLTENDVFNITDRLVAQNADGYFLFTNCRLGVNLERILNKIRQKGDQDILVWDRILISQITVLNPDLFRTFFPDSFRNWIRENREIFLSQSKLYKSRLVHILNSMKFVNNIYTKQENHKRVRKQIAESIKLVYEMISDIDETLRQLHL